MLFHKDNAPAHKSVIAMAAMHDCGFILFDLLPYSPDLAPSDYILFPNIERNLARRHFLSEEEVAAVEFFRD